MDFLKKLALVFAVVSILGVCPDTKNTSFAAQKRQSQSCTDEQFSTRKFGNSF
jgi:hypothetical protein